MKSGIELSYIDPDVRPQDDLFRHVNGGWLTNAEIPADRARDGAFLQLHEEAQENLRTIIEAAAADPDGSDEAQKIGDLYASFLDEQSVEALGAAPIADDLAVVAAIADHDQLIETLGRLGRGGIGGLFGFWVDTDDKQSDRYIVNVTQGGISLPDESYYREDSFAEIRTAFVAHVEAMLHLAGVSDPAGKAPRIMALETRLAGQHWDRVKRRDSTLTYNLHTRDELAALTDGFDWSRYIGALAAPSDAFAEVVVREPSFFAALMDIVRDVELEDWRAWLSWRVVHGFAAYLSSPFVEENFAFYGRTLTGAPEMRARWKRGVSLVEGGLGEAAGKLYVEKHFPPEAKQRMLGLVDNLVQAYRQDIGALDWMSEQTRARALQKLDRFTPKIGYPDQWRDYSALLIERDDLIGNVRRVDSFELDRNLAKIGSPVDRGEWFMNPQTVNAYYNPGMNEIVFPAAILQSPFFDLDADDAANYGGIGAVIGHEIGHGFDDQGSKYDGEGNLNDWWTDADRAEFDKRTKVLIAQYDQFEPAQAGGQHVNGALTVGENIGDLGGLTIAHKAYLIALDGAPAPVLDGLTGPQRLFFGWAQVWRGKARDAEVQRLLAIDPHSPQEFRCNAVVRNLQEFYDAFEVTEDDELYLPEDQRVRIW